MNIWLVLKVSPKFHEVVGAAFGSDWIQVYAAGIKEAVLRLTHGVMLRLRLPHPGSECYLP